MTAVHALAATATDTRRASEYDGRRRPRALDTAATDSRRKISANSSERTGKRVRIMTAVHALAATATDSRRASEYDGRRRPRALDTAATESRRENISQQQRAHGKAR